MAMQQKCRNARIYFPHPLAHAHTHSLSFFLSVFVSFFLLFTETNVVPVSKWLKFDVERRKIKNA